MRSIKSILGERETVTVERTASVSAAARLMSERQIGALPVTDAGRVAGIFSERDVLTRVVAAGKNPEITTVGDVMTSGLIVADVNEDFYWRDPFPLIADVVGRAKRFLPRFPGSAG